jgi:Fur family ferric uptake transcriptional regulator
MKTIFIFENPMNTLSLETTLTHWLTRLQESGYRSTDRCEAIVRVILSSQRALDPVEIFDAARAKIPGLGLVTVYRTLQKLEELGLIQRLHQEEGCRRVLPAVQGHQHFLVCSSCGMVLSFEGDNLAPLFEEITRQTGFAIQNHWLQLFGLCPACRAANG